MKLIKDQLKVRNNRMVHISRYFLRCKLSHAAHENFRRVIKEGMELNGYCNNVSLIENEAKVRIQNYLIACEETIFAAGIEIVEEYCEVREILEDFRDERLLMMKFLNGDLDETMFI